MWHKCFCERNSFQLMLLFHTNHRVHDLELNPTLSLEGDLWLFLGSEQRMGLELLLAHKQVVGE